MNPQITTGILFKTIRLLAETVLNDDREAVLAILRKPSEDQGCEVKNQVAVVCDKVCGKLADATEELWQDMDKILKDHYECN